MSYFATGFSSIDFLTVLSYSFTVIWVILHVLCKNFIKCVLLLVFFFVLF